VDFSDWRAVILIDYSRNWLRIVMFLVTLLCVVEVVNCLCERFFVSIDLRNVFRVGRLVSDIDFIHSDSPFKRNELPHQRTEFILYGRPKAFRLRRPSTRSVSFVTSERSVVFVHVSLALSLEVSVGISIVLRDDRIQGSEGIAKVFDLVIEGDKGFAKGLTAFHGFNERSVNEAGGGLGLSHDRLLSGTEAVGGHRRAPKKNKGGPRDKRGTQNNNLYISIYRQG
jgi:hypothetical protein